MIWRSSLDIYALSIYTLNKQEPDNSSVLNTDKSITEKKTSIGHQISSTSTVDSVVIESDLQVISLHSYHVMLQYTIGYQNSVIDTVAIADSLDIMFKPFT